MELGYPDAATVSTYVGIYAHKDTPAEYRRTLMDAMKKTCEEQDFKDAIGRIGEAHVCAGPEFMKEAIEKPIKIVVPILKELGIYAGQKWIMDVTVFTVWSDLDFDLQSPKREI